MRSRTVIPVQVWVQVHQAHDWHKPMHHMAHICELQSFHTFAALSYFEAPDHLVKATMGKLTCWSVT
jgi:hypothetical protein